MSVEEGVCVAMEELGKPVGKVGGIFGINCQGGFHHVGV